MALTPTISTVVPNDWGSVLTFNRDTQRAMQKMSTVLLGSGSSPSFSGLTLVGFSGVLKATAGVVSGGATTSNVPEGTNLYYTDARARASISETVTGLDYNNTTGVLSLTTNYVIPTTTEESAWNAASAASHAAVTLAASADVLLGLTGQALSLDTQVTKRVLIGPASGADAAPTFRALETTDIPALAYEASGSIATHAALTTGVHGLAITAGQTLTVTTGGTLGSAAYTASSAYDVSGAAATAVNGTATYLGLFSGAHVIGAATNTDAQVSAAVTASHAAMSCSITGITLTGQALSLTSGYVMSHNDFTDTYKDYLNQGVKTTDGPTFDHLYFGPGVNVKLSCPYYAGNTIYSVFNVHSTAAMNGQILLSNAGTYHTGFLASSDPANALTDPYGWGVYGGPNSYLSGNAYSVAWILSASVPDMRIVASTNLVSVPSSYIMVAKRTGKVGFGGITAPNETIEAAGKIRANTAFSLNGTDGISDSGTGVPTAITISGGIVTAVTKNDYLDQAVKTTSSPTLVALTCSTIKGPGMAVHAGTSPGTDNSCGGLAGGGALDNTRGGVVICYGKDFYGGAAPAGKVYLTTVVANAAVEISPRVGIGVYPPLEQVHASDTVRADTAFNLNGTDGVTQASSAGTVCDVTAIAGGIATAQRQVTYLADGVHTLAGLLSFTTVNGRITAVT